MLQDDRIPQCQKIQGREAVETICSLLHFQTCSEMMFQVENNPEGYVVSCYHDLQWHPLRNFGERQGDARFFKEYDCPKLEDGMIRALIKHYDPSVKYIRLNGGRFKKQRED